MPFTGITNTNKIGDTGVSSPVAKLIKGQDMTDYLENISRWDKRVLKPLRKYTGLSSTAAK